ncbi:hypothetical protein FIU97_02900 [Roseivivax sp. THAF40]|uniref:zinc uptake protein ZrgA n=1 Tax=unclassified Roseivivax TaxID=2639302 RepID=UPI001268E5A4|nr:MULTISPECIES: DUF2796 domain-containing protein [unclassified Roseivivax]QFS81714.1 hypothetical protein FIV09_02640 [Roseivivax sp. THAF197b]QFT45514.1 hypothetical protein FIU97_02900 [Roseivivax sp. THAF40]
MKHAFSLIALLAAAPAVAQDARQLDAHEHGVGELNIAIEGTTVAMELHAPGADIVGFEYAAESETDRAAVDAAVATLARPLDLFVLPAAAECSVTQASAALESDEAHEDHDHGDEHASGDDHKHDAHEEEDHAHEGEHEHEDHAHGDDHAEHEDHAHEDDHAEHEDHADGARHSEFHAEYTLDCANPEALSEITFAYFDTFENARELEVQILTASGAQAFEVERDAPALDLRNLF